MSLMYIGQRGAGSGGVSVAISGSYVTGGTLTATATGATGITVTGYQWTRNGTNIAGATSATYVLQAGDLGTTIGCRVSATQTVTGSVGVPAAAAGYPAGQLFVGGQPLYLNGQPLMLA